MLSHRGIAVVALGVATYALYKTGALTSAAKTVAKAGSKVSKWSKEQLEKLNNDDCNTETINTVTE